MTPAKFILGSVTLAALGYGLKKYTETQSTATRYDYNYDEESTSREPDDSFEILYETKREFFETTLELYKAKLAKIPNLPQDAVIKNGEIAFTPEKYDTALAMYDTASLLALELKEQIKDAKAVLDEYLPKMDIFLSDTYSFLYTSKEDNRALARALELISKITEIADISILDDAKQLDPAFIATLNSIKDSTDRLKEAMQVLEDAHHSELSEIIIHHQNEKPIPFEFVYELLQKGEKHTLLSTTISANDALMAIAMYVVKEVKKIKAPKALIVNFTIPHNMSLDTLEKAIERIVANLGEEIVLQAGTQCSYEHSEHKISVDAVVVSSLDNLC